MNPLVQPSQSFPQMKSFSLLSNASRLTSNAGLGLLILSTAAIVAAAPTAHDAAAEKSAGHGSEVVRLDVATMQEFGIETATAGPGQLRKEVQLPGEVKLNESGVAHIVPRFPGVVTAVHRNLGDTVKAGDILATIESNDSLVAYDLKALVGGTIISRHLALGEVLETTSEPFVVADLGTVWVDFSVYQKDIGLIREGQTATVVAPHGLGTATATVSYLGPTMSETTRTALARVVLPNPQRLWLPGMFVTGRVVVETTAYPVVVPQTAIQVFEDRESVFVLTKEGFEPRPVKLGKKDSTSVEVVEGLAPGETFASRGAFHLKATLLKGSLGDGHNH